MRRQISSLDFGTLYIMGIVTSIFQMIVATCISVLALTIFRDNIGISIIIFLFSLFAFLFAVRYFIYSINLVDMIVTDHGFIIERFVKKEEFQFSVIKEIKYFYPSFLPAFIFEPRIKIVFNKKTSFGNSVYIIPTGFDEKNNFKIDVGIKAFLDSKIKN